MNHIINLLITIGGLGFINYYLLDHMGLWDTEDKDKNEKLTFCLLFSIPDYAIYLLTNTFLNLWLFKSVFKLKGNWLYFWNVSLAVFLSACFTFLFGKLIVNAIREIINLSRKNNGHAELTIHAPWIDLLDNPHSTRAFLYTLDHKPVGYGYIDCFSDPYTDGYNLTLAPRKYGDKFEQPSYDDMIKEASSLKHQNKDNSRIYINVDRNFILIVINED